MTFAALALKVRLNQRQRIALCRCYSVTEAQRLMRRMLKAGEVNKAVEDRGGAEWTAQGNHFAKSSIASNQAGLPIRRVL